MVRPTSRAKNGPMGQLKIYFLDVKKFGPSPICPRMPPELNLVVNKCCGFVEKKFALE